MQRNESDQGFRSVKDMTHRRFALLGYPVAHSKSPKMMAAAFHEMGLRATYEAISCSPENLGLTLDTLKQRGYTGLNITIPHKQAIFAYLDWVDETARSIGAVNTVVLRDGEWHGYNTDALGYIRSLSEEVSLKLPGMKVVIWGAGGAARAVGHGLLLEGVGELSLVNRTPQKARELANDLSKLRLGNVQAVSMESAEQDVRTANLIVQTTPIGMTGYPAVSPIPSDWVRMGQVVSDLIYTPLKTTLMRAAHERGATVHGGAGMLVHQGAMALELWTGQSAPIKAMRQALIAALNEAK
ncbi:shikimate dehydrogenase [Risungbinella massiliensis]|uniref:shikimate dehydrogenase n=1 Tax=Risungbinella massiliensis TaxID=1329796 RepID=UPI00069BB706|nr:shikimate dehydrogenase [Risungbinella massiliensis]